MGASRVSTEMLLAFDVLFNTWRLKTMIQSNQGAALFADCEGFLTELSATDEAVLTGGGGHKKRRGGSGSSSSKSSKSRSGSSKSGFGKGGYYCYYH